MSLKSPRLFAPLSVIGLAVTIVSCGQQSNSPTSPTGLSGSIGVRPAVTEYWVTLSDEAPAPAPADDAPAPAPAPGDPGTPPPPDPAPAPPAPGTPPPPPPPGSMPSPWPPGPPPAALPGVPVPTPPSTHFRLHIKIDPEQVPHSGVPVPLFSCRDNRFTWYYDQHLISDTGIKVTIDERENFFDGRFVSKNTERIDIDGNRSVILHTRWCSAYPIPHYAQTRFKGRDETGDVFTISGPLVPMMSPK